MKSMTGFGSAQSANAEVEVAWELRSVNGRGLDVKLRMPQGLERLEKSIKDEAARHMARGNIQAALTINRVKKTAEIAINKDILQILEEASEELVARGAAVTPSADGLLSLRGVIEVSDARESSTQLTDEIKEEIFTLFQTALRDLCAMREEEGKRIGAALLDQINKLEGWLAEADSHPDRSVDAISKRLADNIEQLVGIKTDLDKDRLHQEAAILATKADIREELDRMVAHIASAKELITQETAPIGRKLDFLMQEFGRETNTLCAKAHTSALSKIGLDMKVIVDQMREQVQNIE